MSNELKATLGEWKLNGAPNPKRPMGYNLYTKEGGPETIEHIAHISMGGLIDKERLKENALLIAASKDLYNALKELLECDYTSGTHLVCAQIKAQEALIKANNEYICPVRLPSVEKFNRKFKP